MSSSTSVGDSASVAHSDDVTTAVSNNADANAAAESGEVDVAVAQSASWCWQFLAKALPPQDSPMLRARVRIVDTVLTKDAVPYLWLRTNAHGEVEAVESVNRHAVLPRHVNEMLDEYYLCHSAAGSPPDSYAMLSDAQDNSWVRYNVHVYRWRQHGPPTSLFRPLLKRRSCDENCLSALPVLQAVGPDEYRRRYRGGLPDAPVIQPFLPIVQHRASLFRHNFLYVFCVSMALFVLTILF